MKEPWGIHWFRRDLRLPGNPALGWNWKQTRGRALGIFCFDPMFLSRPDFSVDRFGFFLKTLADLKTQLVAAGGDLLVLDQGPREAFPKLFECLRNSRVDPPRWISWNRDYEPFARERDAWIEAYLEKNQATEVHTERDHLIIEPSELINESSLKSSKHRAFYSVYSPFSRKWLEIFKAQDLRVRITEQRKAMDGPSPAFKLTWQQLFPRGQAPEDSLDDYLHDVLKRTRVPLPDAGHSAALKRLREFSRSLTPYHEQRDFPDRDATSGMSLYLKNGSITTSQILAELDLPRSSDEPVLGKTGRTKFLQELLWREFYYHILWHCPWVERESFLRVYRDLPWENNEAWFEAWKQGQTGYPIVDAGMRELAHTGRMHNRVRMIVASFLTKDLLIDWRWGERYFMERLLDGDLASNNGGWQWAASTGCDPQPYFRIFNPELQSKKFDPQGRYIKKWIPELSRLSGSSVHRPSPLESGGRYPSPLVDHSEQRKRALALYKVTGQAAK